METEIHEIEVLDEGKSLEDASPQDCCKGSVSAFVDAPEPPEK